MSYILDALQKVEREKAKHRQTDSVKERLVKDGEYYDFTNVLNYRKRVIPLILIIFLVGLFTGSSVIFISLRQGNLNKQVSQIHNTETEPSLKLNGPQLLPGGEEVKPMEPTDTFKKHDQKEKDVSDTSAEKPSPEMAASQKHNEEPPTIEQEVASLEETISAPPKIADHKKKSSTDDLISIPEIKINILAWHREKTKRFAVVNINQGELIKKVYEGDMVLGIKILSIHPDTIEINYEGKETEISVRD
jgi:hypothetical protein